MREKIKLHWKRLKLNKTWIYFLPFILMICCFLVGSGYGALILLPIILIILFV